MRLNLRNTVIAISAVLLVLAAGMLMAQTVYTGSILGSVKDSTGAAIPNARVTVTNTATGVSSPTTTTSVGDYTVLNLIPGHYSVVAEAAGFDQEQATGITLVVAQQARVDLTLKPGSASTTVTVTANAVELDTDNAAVSQLVAAQQITDLPLDGRNFEDLLYIGAGTVTSGGEQGTNRAGKGAAIIVNGGRPESDSYLLDGILNSDQSFNTPSTMLSVDAIEQFKVLSETYSAQYGLGATQISVISKSGTNQFHGSLFEFDRNNYFDAKQYFNPGAQTLRQNQFGFVADGPVRIPWIYNGKDKTFFMANYEGWRIYSTSNAGFTNVPFPANLAGDFSTPVTDPTTGEPFPGGVVSGTTYASIVPAGRISTLAKASIAEGIFPAPNCTTTCDGFNWRGPNEGSTIMNQQTYRIDEDMGKLGRAFGRGSYSTFASYGYGGPSGAIAGSGINEIDTNWAVGHTINFGSNKVNQFTMGLMDASAINYGGSVSQAVQTSLGLTGVFTDLSSQQRVFPHIQFNSTFGEQIGGFGGANNAYTGSDNPMWQFSDAFSYIHGAHTMTVGADYKSWFLYRNLADNFLGEYTYGDLITGNEIEEFLLGYFEGANGFLPGPFSQAGSAGNQHDYKFSYFGTFAQDDWAATNKLTLNIGLRWDYRPIPYEAHNRMGWLDAANPLGGLCIADPALTTDGVAPVGNGFYRYCGTNHPGTSELNNFGPRFGIAYRIDNKTVVRGGYGFFWDGIEGREMDNAGDIYPYVSRQDLTQTVYSPSTLTTNQLWPSYSTVSVVTGGYNGPDTFLAPMLTNTPENPLVKQGTLSVERELARDTTLEVYYVGNTGSRLLDRQDINQAEPLVDPASCYAGLPTPASCEVLNRRPYPNFATYIEGNPIGYSNYNALNFKFERRSSQLAVTSVYTWSKSMDDKSSAANAGSEAQGWNGFLNNWDPQLDYGRSDFNTGQRFVTSVVYDLPVGRGKQFANQVNPVVNAVIGGWEASGIYTVQQGFPYNVNVYDYGVVANTSPTVYLGGLLDVATGDGVNRANTIGNPKKFQLSHSQNATTLAAVYANNYNIVGRPEAAVFGNEHRNDLNMPGINNFVLGLYKNTDITERVKFQLRLEAFNAFNHPQFDPNPGISANAGGNVTMNNLYDSGALGQVTASDLGREVQISGKFIF
ncbi:MAG: TonB-dependent receptor [Terracidiphilus sp.]